MKIFLSASLLLLSSLPAAAGVYLFRDSTGRVVLSDAPTTQTAKRVMGEPKEEESI